MPQRGYELAVALDGEQGVAMAKSEAPAFILIDMSLPGLDGWEAARSVAMWGRGVSKRSGRSRTATRRRAEPSLDGLGLPS